LNELLCSHAKPGEARPPLGFISENNREPMNAEPSEAVSGKLDPTQERLKYYRSPEAAGADRRDLTDVRGRSR